MNHVKEPGILNFPYSEAEAFTDAKNRADINAVKYMSCTSFISRTSSPHFDAAMQLNRSEVRKIKVEHTRRGVSEK